MINITQLIRSGGFDCLCGRRHAAALEDLILASGALGQIPKAIASYGGKRVFILTDKNAYAAAGEQVCRILNAAGIAYGMYVFPQDHLEPDEFAVGSAMLHFDADCDLILGVGSGVINDICKILANCHKCTYFIVATAPSMDGFASATSSMARDGLKVSVPSTCPQVIIADLDVLCRAPMVMLQSGLGDMVAKYISLCDWEIAHLLVDEYYCPTIAAMVRETVDSCMRNVEGLSRREPEAVASVMEGLVLTGIAMSYAGLSRPASGMEHYFSHIWDMRGLEFGTPTQTHGIQCAMGTVLTYQVYDYIRSLKPNREKALAYVRSFDLSDWERQLRTFLGSGAEAMIAGEKKEGKYDVGKHALRLERIIDHWEEIQEIISRTLIPIEQLQNALDTLGVPTDPATLDLTPAQIATSMRMTKDIRDKYIASRLLWDLGELDDAAQALFG